MQSSLQSLAEDSDLHIRELAYAARQYATATAENCQDYDALYNHGLVLQELAGKLASGCADQVAFLRQVGTGLSAVANHVQLPACESSRILRALYLLLFLQTGMRMLSVWWILLSDRHANGMKRH